MVGTSCSGMSGTTSIGTGDIPKLRDSGMGGTKTPVWMAQVGAVYSLTVWLCVVLVFEGLPTQPCTEPIRLFIFSFFTPIVKDELGVLQQITAAGLPDEPRIAYSFCCVFVLLFPRSYANSSLISFILMVCSFLLSK
jgi:hypothetical protein